MDGSLSSSPIVDVALGLIFFYVVMSLVASAVQEWVATLVGLRASNLRQGLERLIGDEYARKLYEHPAISNLAKSGKKPSYLSTDTVGRVLMEVIAKEAGEESFDAKSADEAKALVSKIPEGNPVRAILLSLIDGGENEVDGFRTRLAGWFDEGMERVSGWYKRKAKMVILAIATISTVAFNASSIHIAKELWENDALRARIAAEAEVTASKGTIDEAMAGNLKNRNIQDVQILAADQVQE